MPSKITVPFAARFPNPMEVYDLGRAVIDVAENGGDEGFHFTAGAVWAIENLCEGGRLTEDAARGMLMALYENQGLDEIEIIPEPE